MFLANSLNEKLKRSFSEIEIEPTSNINLQAQPPKTHTHPAILTVHNKLTPETEQQKIDIISKEDWEKKFTLPRLRAKWKETLQLDFNPNHKKFPDDLISPAAKKAREYIKDLIDKDTLQVKNKRWNTSTNARDKFKPSFKQTLFEVIQGLTSFPVTKLKDNVIEEGADSLNYMTLNGERWNKSTLLENWEKKKMDKENIEKGKSNSIQYWNQTQYARFNETLIPISEERQKFEGERYYKKYKTPIQDSKDRYSTMQKVKELTWIERENIAKDILHNNPGSKEDSEKINSLIGKEMYNTYRTKYNELTGRIKTKAQISNKVDWKDDDITDRIMTITEWRDIKWFKPMYSDSQLTRNTDREKEKEKDELKMKELLKPLVPKASIIKKEEENIKEKIFKDYKQAMKKELLQKRNKAFSSDQDSLYNTMASSKYPIDEEEYNKILQSYDKPFDGKDTYSSSNYKDIVIEDSSNIIPPQNLNNTHYFLEAYKKVALRSVSKDRKEIKKLQKNKRVEYQYMHPGTFVSINCYNIIH